MLRMGDGRRDELAAAAAGAPAGSSPPGQDPRLKPGVLRAVAILAVAALVVPILASPALLDVTLSASETVTVPASADAQVLSNFADRNYGSGIRLRSQAKPGQRHESLLRFVLPALSGEIRDARLRLYVRDGSPNGGVVRRVVGSWTERFVTWKTRPRLATTTIGRIHATGSPGHWITVPLRLNGLHSGQTVDLAIVGASTNGAWFASSETATGPRLLLTIVGPASTTGPTPTPTGAATRAPTAAPTSRPGGAPTSIPTSAPTSHPTSAPTGAPTSAPTAAPPGGAIAVPSSIDSTGATDRQRHAQCFLATSLTARRSRSRPAASTGWTRRSSSRAVTT